MGLRWNSPLSEMRRVAYIIESGRIVVSRVSRDVLLTAVEMGSRLCILYHHFLLCLACSVSLLLTLRCEGEALIIWPRADALFASLLIQAPLEILEQRHIGLCV